ncbi:hypothetical protein H5410_025062 [Solanum commersonii]|uniref:Uncharacterized protein n=1 Tax=Solanum commersonii TaxID=4109 RepID=A0A9J5YT63_SOLCO|nr:hypothetical protein H5410_025062 [Solanum commersonii]
MMDFGLLDESIVDAFSFENERMNEVNGNKQIEGSAVREVNTGDGETEDEVIQSKKKPRLRVMMPRPMPIS